jgi:4-alpha-glucanotransferase
MSETEHLPRPGEIIPTYLDARGKEVSSKPAVIQKVSAALRDATEPEAEPAATVVLRENSPTGETALSAGDRRLSLPRGLAAEIYDLSVPGWGPSVNLLLAPEQTFQGEFHKGWLLAVQLYGIRSRRNWGHGDFSDLKALLELAARSGAAGVGINPLHALMHEQVGPSPYSPSSRLFLNYLYIDVSSIDHADAIDARARSFASSDLIDYPRAIAEKTRALRSCYERFTTTRDGQRGFEEFVALRGERLRKFACFETLRQRLPNIAAWPQQWRRSSPETLAAVEEKYPDDIRYHMYLQWIADSQLQACSSHARSLGLKIGIYADVAVGVHPDGADVWSDPSLFLTGMSIGAPPDLLNVAGQDWGLTSYNPRRLEQQKFASFREMLRQTMRFSGAIRLDHVLWLNRLYFVPRGDAPADGCYVRFPLQALLGALSIESTAHRCIVIGEDLGTVPVELRTALAEWGVWRYHVAQFERTTDGTFLDANHYTASSLATFSTHDLAPFAAWKAGEDIALKHKIGIDPGESSDERRQAVRRLMERVRSRPTSDPGSLEFAEVARFLATTSARLLAVSLEDALESGKLLNVPGTVDEYYNWRVASPILLEDVADEPRFRSMISALSALD